MSKKSKIQIPDQMTDGKSIVSGRIATLSVTLGLLAIMIAAALPLLRMAVSFRGYIYAAGALLLLLGRILTPKVKDAPLRLKRLIRMEFWTSLIFVAGAVCLFLPSAGSTDWLAFTLAGAVLTAYTSIMIPRIRVDSKK